MWHSKLPHTRLINSKLCLGKNNIPKGNFCIGQEDWIISSSSSVNLGRIAWKVKVLFNKASLLLWVLQSAHAVVAGICWPQGNSVKHQSNLPAREQMANLHSSPWHNASLPSHSKTLICPIFTHSNYINAGGIQQTGHTMNTCVSTHLAQWPSTQSGTSIPRVPAWAHYISSPSLLYAPPGHPHEHLWGSAWPLSPSGARRILVKRRLMPFSPFFSDLTLGGGWRCWSRLSRPSASRYKFI